MKLGSIASGSSGNCTFIGTEKACILVDVGIAKKRVEAGLKAYDVSPDEIDGIFLTHEHSDHIKGLGVFLRAHETPVYATQETIDQVLFGGKIGKVDESLFHPILPDHPMVIKDLKIDAFSISHDAANPVAYRFDLCDGSKSCAVATDMGCFNDYTITHLKKLDGILLEANHDVNMLQVGPYPYSLKQRILGDRGHLSNESSGRLLNEILHDQIKKVYLGHLSEHNNMDELAFETVKYEITSGDSPYKGSDFDIEVARRDQTLALVNL